MERARSQVRWFPALVSNHVVDLVSRYPLEELPPALTMYVRNRPGYDYQDHGRVGAHHADFVSDEIIDRFCVIGSVEQCTERLQQLIDAGVHEFNNYLMFEERERNIQQFGHLLASGKV
jgi:alkanesulfonate monooxygenase SsuD/methylene tetrahydromethanopterin reductase-like flavin-dependent oxidoreductase (luciferase family)